MRKGIIVLISIVGIAVLCNCAQPPSMTELNSMDLGAPPTNHKQVITDYFNATLKDPYTAHITIGEPYKWWMRDGLIYGAKTYTGWMVEAYVNAKNSFGGYTGTQKYGFLFRDGKVIKIMTPEDWALSK